MTDKEILEQSPKKLFKLGQLLNDGIITIEDIADIVPGIMHTNSKGDLALTYLSRSGRDMIRYSLEEINTLGLELFRKHQSSHTLDVIFPKVIEKMTIEDNSLVVPFFQDWKIKKDDTPIYHLTSTKILNEKELISISLVPNRVEHLTRRMDYLFGINKVYEKFFKRFNNLTKREKEILNLLRKEMTRKEISYTLFISEKTVKKHLENIFKKLGTSKRTELEKIAAVFLPTM